MSCLGQGWVAEYIIQLRVRPGPSGKSGLHRRGGFAAVGIQPVDPPGVVPRHRCHRPSGHNGFPGCGPRHRVPVHRSGAVPGLHPGETRHRGNRNQAVEWTPVGESGNRSYSVVQLSRLHGSSSTIFLGEKGNTNATLAIELVCFRGLDLPGTNFSTG